MSTHEALQRATTELHRILAACRNEDVSCGDIETRDWNVEAVVRDDKDSVKVVVYFNAKGNLTPKIQGKDSPLRQRVEQQLHGSEPLASAFLPSNITTWIGVDESGKGDYFGPLVAAGVCVTPEDLLKLKSALLRDSKELSAERITIAARKVREICGERCTVVTVPPAKYNTFMEGTSFGKNSQRILAWMHARCIENLLEAGCEAAHAICDKFAGEHVIERALLPLGRGITVHQHVRAEADPAVAAASVLARDEFVRRMKQLEQQCGHALPFGASDERGIAAAGTHIVRTHGWAALRDYAKLHFRSSRLIKG